MDFVEKVKLFNEIAGTKNQYDTRKVALYLGLILEEVGEAIEAIGMDKTELFETLNSHATQFKSGDYDLLVESKLTINKENRVELLDAFVDIAVVSIGGSYSLGADVQGACQAVADNNLEKFPLINGVRTVLRDENGKVMKPEGYTSVKLDGFVS
jgi:predicted HAD superfamily Cof-like phosphohydrolase